tara:strand:+ start:32039 stop:32485 length:447 start_codon:yes stop_codon:yes gene_type:complete
MSSIFSFSQVEQNKFNFDDDTESFIAQGGSIKATPKGYITFSPVSNYARIVQSTNYVNANKYKYLHIRISNQSKTNDLLAFSLEGKTSGKIPISTNDGSDFKEYTFKITSDKWSGNVSEFKIFPRNSESKLNEDDGDLIIDYITFSKR